MHNEKGKFLNRRLKALWIIIGVTVIILFAALVAVRLVSGRSLGIRGYFAGLVRPIVSPVKAVLYHREVTSYSHGDFTNIVFLHHSTGRNLINQGQVREGFEEAGYTFWDHDYNPIGLRDPQGGYTGYDYGVPDDNTNPDGLAGIFSQPVYDLPLNTLSGLMQHEVVVIKSCFPVSDIRSDEQMELYKSYYLSMRDVMDDYPDKIFILTTQPPLNPAQTNPEIAARARAFADWLKSEEYLESHPNVYTFDFFNYLAEDTPTEPDYNMLRREYREGKDSHPNQIANETIGPFLVDFVMDTVDEYREKYQSND